MFIMIEISDVSIVAASDRDRERGLLGYVTCVADDVLSIREDLKWIANNPCPGCDGSPTTGKEVRIDGSHEDADGFGSSHHTTA